MDNQSSNAADFHSQTDDVFGRIATRYDLLCDLFSLGIHRLWKRRVANLIAQEPWNCLLDAASGTGDVVLRLVKQQPLRPEQIIITSDISPQMLAVAKQRAGPFGSSLDFRVLDANSMPEIPNA
ncbi:MAG TPA: class I SAM-dependent methyltransferase, partial [Anaerolineales bacterium]|nr:class I SAM-dependent methyltransferase [Anaerolineales bacterium]